MAGRKRHKGHENHERWLVSYADFITLLFAFFVVMFASSQADKGKAAQVSEAVKGALEKGYVSKVVAEILGGAADQKGKGNAQMRGPGGAQSSREPDSARVVELAPSLQMLSAQLEAEVKAGKVHLSLEPRGLVVSLRESAYFPSGGDAIAEETYDSLAKVAEALRHLPNPVRMEGHTDSIPIHNARFRSNWELSAARGIAMLELFAERFEIPRDRMAIAGYADTAPVDSNDTLEGRSHNRRVDIVFLNQYGLKSEPAQQHPNPAHEPPKPH